MLTFYREVLWHSPESDFTARAHTVILYSEFFVNELKDTVTGMKVTGKNRADGQWYALHRDHPSVGPVNGRRRYYGMPSLIGRANTQNDPCFTGYINEDTSFICDYSGHYP